MKEKPTAKEGGPRGHSLCVNMSTCQRKPEKPRENRVFVDVDTVDAVDSVDAIDTVDAEEAKSPMPTPTVIVNS